MKTKNNTNTDEPQSRWSVGLAQERYEMALSYERLCRCPGAQAEAIAQHYAVHAKMSMELLKLIEYRRYADDKTNIDVAIAYLIEQIKRNHRHDLGIDLEWANKKNEGLAQQVPLD